MTLSSTEAVTNSWALSNILHSNTGAGLLTHFACFTHFTCKFGEQCKNCEKYNWAGLRNEYLEWSCICQMQLDTRINLTAIPHQYHSLGLWTGLQRGSRSWKKWVFSCDYSWWSETKLKLFIYARRSTWLNESELFTSFNSVLELSSES